MTDPRCEIVVRRAEAGDMKAVLEMIQELADFEKMSSGPQLSVEDLIRDAGLDGGSGIFHCYIAETQNSSSSGMQAIGYSICFFSYSTWKGKSYFMEDIYIKPSFRNIGAGKTLFKEIVRNAKEFGCKRVDFHVLGWNPARKFYDHLGATDLTELEEWHFYRLSEDALNRLTTK